MNLDELTIRVLFLFLPGIVCSLVVAHLTTHRDLRPADHLIPSFVFGFLVYVLYSATAEVWNQWVSWGQLPPYELIPPEPSKSQGISPVAILVSILLAFILAFAFSALKNHKALNRVARALKVTRKFGDRDVWSYVMNEVGTPWVVIRNPAQRLYYLGEVAAFSDEENTRELFLRNTRVYDDDTGDEVYFAGDIYLSFPREGITIEIPAREET